MKRKTKRILCAALSTVMAASLVAESVLHINAETTSAETKVEESVSFSNVTGKFDLSNITLSQLNAKVLQAFDRNKSEKKTVIVSLSGNALLDEANGQSVPEFITTNAAQKVLEKIEEKQDAFLRRLSGSNIGYTLKYRYNTIDNAVAIEVKEEDVVSIKEMPEVESVVISQSYAVPKTVDTKSVGAAVSNSANANKTGIYNSKGYTDYSAGTVVAVLDTGLDYTHPAYQQLPPEETLALKKTDVATLMEQKAFACEDRTALSGEKLTANDVFVSSKVPFAYDYADDDPDVYPSYSNHGTHVAGIVAGQAASYTNKDGETEVYEEGDVIPDGYSVGDPIPFTGVAPDAQLVICKVFTDDLDDEDIGGAVAEDILAALQDCVLLGVDVINMSLGTSAGFSAEGGDPEGDYLDTIYQSIQDAGISLICAASNDYSSAYGSAFGTNLTSNPDSGTVGSPSTFSAALSVASISGQESEYLIANEGTENEFAVYYLEANDKYNNPIDFADNLIGEDVQSGELEYVVVPGKGLASNYTAQVKRLFNEKPYQRIALVSRGDNTFEEKVRIAKNNKAAAVIVYNNVAGEIRMSLGELEEPIPSISINRAAGEAMAAVVTKTNRIGKIKIDRSLAAGPFMSDFSSWGPTPDLRLKPEITAHGGEITSTVPGGYGEQSGTSMASPNMAGFVALARSYVKQNLSAVVAEMVAGGLSEPVAINRLVNQLVMSTATTAYDEDGFAYSPRKQGAGLANLANVVGGTGAYLYTDNAENDYRPKIELFDKLDEKENIELEFYIHNFSSFDQTYNLQALVMTESVEKYDGFAVAEQAYMLDDNAPVWYVGGSTEAHSGALTVTAGEKIKVKAVITLSAAEKKYFADSFENGMYLEGFVKLISQTSEQCDLTMPFLGFYGDWSKAPMLDLTVYEVTADDKDPSLDEEEKDKARVWATQPFASYYNEDYIIPMGSFVYLLPDDAEEMWTDEDRGAISRYNIYFGENEDGNYLTTTSIRAVYAGLLRNARTVNYTLENAVTGELIKADSINRVGKAYTAGASGVPANVELKLAPEDYGLVSNGKYKMSFEFLLDYGDGSANKNTFEFSFYVDYEAPVLEDARVRYDNYKEGTKTKQKIYLEFDIFDNHYAQSLMLCYPDMQYNFESGEDEKVLKLATEYVTPVRNANKNGTTTVSIEVTDIYDKIKNEFYVQLDDYALNNSLFSLSINSSQDTTAKNVTPDKFELADGEKEITVDVYGTHKVSLVYEGNADLSNFTWISRSPYIGVKNGEIVGLRAGKSGTVVVTNGKGVSKNITVNVTNTVQPLDIPSISFGEMASTDDWLTKAQGSVEIFADKEFTLEIVTDPWYYPKNELDILWTSTNENIATVTQEGVVKTLQKGTASIIAYICENGKPTNFSANVQLRVQDEFRIGSYILQQYNGIGHNGVICPHCGSAWMYTELETIVEGDVRTDGVCPTPSCYAARKVIKDHDDTVLKIPDDRNIMYIGENAFKDNDNVKKIVIPKTVMDIQERAFVNCQALEEIYFIDTVAKEIADADIKLVYREAFYNCQSLKLLDLSNCKTFTVAEMAFADCTSLNEVRKAENIGTMHHYAFQGCTALESIDLSGLHMSGNYVFQGCTSLAEVSTGKFTAIGNYMFSGCNNIKSILLKTSKIGIGAFEGCTGLESVEFRLENGAQADIGDRAFRNCTSLTTLTSTGEDIRSIGKQAFANTALTEFVIPSSVQTLGGEFLKGSLVTEITLSDSVDISQVKLAGVSFAGLTVKIPDNSTVYYKDSVTGIVYNYEKTKLLLANTASGVINSILNTVTEIAAYAFAGSKVTNVTLPESVEKIGEGAFQGSTLAQIDLSTTQVTEIAAYTFAETALETLLLPKKYGTLVELSAIGEYAFAETAIASLELCMADGATIGSYAFALSDLVDVNITGKTVMGDGLFQNCASLENARLQPVKLGEFNFYGCTSLDSVIFYEGATDLGRFTFADTPVRSVLFATGVTEIADGGMYFANGQIKTGGTFSNTPNLTEFNFVEIKKIGSYAFENSAVESLLNTSSVEAIGDYAFLNCNGLEEIEFLKVKEIGDGAFSITNRGNAYTSVSMPLVERIGDYAFQGNGMESFALGEKLGAIGDGAFASAKELTTFDTSASNLFFVEDGVLFEKVGQQYKLVCFPAGLSVDGGEYALPDGTVSIQANAFSGLKEGAIEKVVLPYSLKSIGDGAFYQSGVTTFVFESVSAPALESKYDDETAAWFYAYGEANNRRPYYGYFYTNFGGEFKDYTEYVGQKSNLTIYYPVNGVGYDNHVYATYFGTKHVTTEVIDNVTRAFRDIMASLPTIDTVRSWTNASEENRQTMLDTAKLLSSARSYFNSITSETQMAFLENGAAEELMEYESVMRTVKAAYGVSVKVSRVYYEAAGYKTNYLVGDTFDSTGLKFVVLYDDGSSEVVAASDFTLLTTRALTKSDVYVEFSGYGKTVRVGVNVAEEAQGGDSSTEEGGCGGSIAGSGLVAMITLATMAAFILKKKGYNE